MNKNKDNTVMTRKREMNVYAQLKQKILYDYFYGRLFLTNKDNTVLTRKRETNIYAQLT